MGDAKNIYTDVVGAPVKIGQEVQIYDLCDDTVEIVYIGCCGVVEYLEYNCGCGQVYPESPMIGVRFADGSIEEFWAEELNFSPQNHEDEDGNKDQVKRSSKRQENKMAYKITIEKPGLPRKQEIIGYVNGGNFDNYRLEQIEKINREFFIKSGLQVGRGGNHVWIANGMGERLAIITEV